MSELEKAARAAGILDLDALMFADASLPTLAEQVRDLMKRKPHFFPPHTGAMTAEQYAAARADAVRPSAQARPVINDGKSVRGLSDGDYARLKNAMGMRTEAWRTYKR